MTRDAKNAVRQQTTENAICKHQWARIDRGVDWFEQSELERAYRRQEHPCPTP